MRILSLRNDRWVFVSYSSTHTLWAVVLKWSPSKQLMKYEAAIYSISFFLFCGNKTAPRMKYGLDYSIPTVIWYRRWWTFNCSAWMLCYFYWQNFILQWQQTIKSKVIKTKRFIAFWRFGQHKKPAAVEHPAVRGLLVYVQSRHVRIEYVWVNQYSRLKNA